MKELKRVTTLAAILFFCTYVASSQKISNIDFDLVKRKTQEKTSAWYYPDLIKRFANGDSTLKAADYGYIYYGYPFSEYYHPPSENEKEKLFAAAYKNAEFSKAIVLGQEALLDDPVNCGLLFRLIVCCDQMGKKHLAKDYARRYFNLLECIYSSGDGKSKTTAFVVIRVDDEYEIADDMDLKVLRQSMPDDNTDLIEMVVPNEKNVQELYFNIAMPVKYLKSEKK